MVALAVEVPREAVTWTFCVVATGKAVAANETDVAPAARVTVAGTERDGLALDSWMTAPPAGAAPESRMAHVYPAPAVTHCKADTPIWVTTALAPPIVTGEPVGDTPVAVGIATETLGAPDALNESAPITPLPMMLEFNPLAMQVMVVEVCAQVIDFPAAVKAVPAVTLNPVTPAGRANVS